MPDTERHLYTAAQVRELDRQAIELHGIGGQILMQRAASRCWTTIRDRSPEPGTVSLICGPGNNGGDGYEIARLAKRDGWVVTVYWLGAVPQGGDAQLAYAAWCADGGTAQRFSGALADADWVVDAMFGTGLARALGDDALQAIGAIAAARAKGAKVLAVDIPTGLDATSGCVRSAAAVEADLTVSFIGRKLGLYTGRGPAVAGERLFDDLGVPAAVYGGVVPVARLQHETELQSALKPRARDAHKGDHGHVLVIGGNHGMMGASLMAGRAALRSGAGLVSIATRPEHASALSGAQAELMCHGCSDARQLRALVVKADVVAVGPGLGTDHWARALLSVALDSGKALVLDADALNLLASEPTAPANAVLTPHPGEAARLLGCSTVDVQRDRLAALLEIERRYAAVVVLKGAGSLISGQAVPAVCPYGNPGMAVGGMGDALTGIIAALRAQGFESHQAAQTGTLLHALAADRAAVRGERGLLPGDLIDQLQLLGNPGLH